MMDNLIVFASGATYGFTSVLVGQPLDTIKTRMQAGSGTQATKSNSMSIFTDLMRREGVLGLYRGGLPLFIGGTLFRSAQFGVNDFAKKTIKEYREKYDRPKSERLFGALDTDVMVAGFCGGLGRGVVEAPFEFVKVRRQVDQKWKLSSIYKGSSVTMLRNGFLFMSFVTYMDISDRVVPGGLGPFLKGSICASLAWLTVWPLDVVKSQVQSGNYREAGVRALLRDLLNSGRLYRGIVPGLTRSVIANGISMMAYTRVYSELTELAATQT